MTKVYINPQNKIKNLTNHNDEYIIISNKVIVAEDYADKYINQALKVQGILKGGIVKLQSKKQKNFPNMVEEKASYA